MDFFSFCKKHPALLYSSFFLIGIGIIYEINFLIPLSLLSFLFLRKKKVQKLLPLLAFALIAFCYGSYKKPRTQELPVFGTILFLPEEMKIVQSHFQKGCFLKGTIHSMEKEGKKVAQNISVSFPVPPDFKVSSPLLFSGTLDKKDSLFLVKPDLDTWLTPPGFSLVKWRFETKKKLANKIHELFTNRKVADLFSALTLGPLEDRMIRFDFARLGLQHILAISGFHFGLIAFLLGFVLYKIFGEKSATILLWMLLTCYFILLGSSPSILRAYLGISFYLLARLLQFQANGLNILGVVLLIELLLNPNTLLHLGFQLSFLATFAILFLLPLTKKWTAFLLPIRKKEEINALSLIEKGVYFLASFIRSSLSLNMAVHLAVTPLCLFYFGQFPLLSLVYNLFIPAAISGSLFLFFLSLPFLFCFPLLADFLNKINQFFTAEILKLISESPIFLDLSLRTPSFSSFLIFLFLLFLFSIPFNSLTHINALYNHFMIRWTCFKKQNLKRDRKSI